MTCASARDSAFVASAIILRAPAQGAHKRNVGGHKKTVKTRARLDGLRRYYASLGRDSVTPERSAAARSSVNAEPPPGRGENATDPPCASASPRAIDRPRP